MLLGAFGQKGQAQDFQMGFSLGTAFYQGDMIKGVIDLKEANIAYGLFLRRYATDKWAVRINWTRGKVSGDDRNARPERGFRFNSTFNEFALLAEYNLIGGYNFNYSGKQEDLFGLYLFAGGALTTLNSKLVSPVGEMTVTPVFTDVTLAMPIGGGLRLNLSERTSIEGEMAARATLTDRIDGLEGGARDYYLTAVINVTLILGNY